MKIFFLVVFFVSISALSFCQANDSTSIVQLLEKESATWRSGDTAAHAACWHIEPYSSILIMAPGDKTFSVPVETIIHPSPSMAGQGGVSKNSNYKMSIVGNSAIVMHNESSTSKNGGESHTFEVRMLKKINGEWKLTGQIIQVL